jgi:SAM-dependent methyltransferase
MRKALVNRTPKRIWLVPIIALVAALLYRNRISLKQIYANIRAFDLPSAAIYDVLFASLLGRFYARVAEEVATACPSGTVLEVGSGPGRLAVLLAQAAPDMTVTGVDISPEMAERAARRAEEAGLGERVSLEVGDVGALPFPDASFDAVVSTLSLHHWPDPVRGLAEVHRVLRPGGEARIYDLAHWLWRPSHGGSQLDRLAAESPFGGGTVEVVRWPASVPAFVLLRLGRRREAAS